MVVSCNSCLHSLELTEVTATTMCSLCGLLLAGNHTRRLTPSPRRPTTGSVVVVTMPPLEVRRIICRALGRVASENPDYYTHLHNFALQFDNFIMIEGRAIPELEFFRQAYAEEPDPVSIPVIQQRRKIRKEK